MFDLHMHTTASDGEYTPKELLDKLINESIKPFSITDHNHCLAYRTFNPKDYDDLIIGTEITTSYRGTVVEILGYHVDPEIINTWYTEFYSEENLERNEKILFDRMVRCARKEGLNISQDLKMPRIEKGISKKTVYNDIVKNEPDFAYTTYKSFFRNALSNPSSPFFINEADTYPSFKEVVDLIHDAKGIAVLAHPYEYGFDTVTPLFEYAQAQGIDGLECFHQSASYRQALGVMDYCEAHGLRGSGGSDFHRESRYVPLGVHMTPQTRQRRCFDWIKE